MDVAAAIQAPPMAAGSFGPIGEPSNGQQMGAGMSSKLAANLSMEPRASVTVPTVKSVALIVSLVSFVSFVSISSIE